VRGSHKRSALHGVSKSPSPPLSPLARYFGLSEGFFLGLQTDYELVPRRRQIADQIEAIRPRAA
jgi:hypothetical protein